MKILNLGSLNIDKTYSVKRFVQPKETIQALDYEEFCGGKGLNQSVALARAGAEVYHAGAVGGDGRILLDMLKEAGADTGYVETLDGASGHAVIQIDESGQNNIIICGGTNRKITREYISSVLEHFGKGDLILLQNEISNIDFAMEEAKTDVQHLALCCGSSGSSRGSRSRRSGAGGRRTTTGSQSCTNGHGTGSEQEITARDLFHKGKPPSWFSIICKSFLHKRFRSKSL